MRNSALAITNQVRIAEEIAESKRQILRIRGEITETIAQTRETIAQSLNKSSYAIVAKSVSDSRAAASRTSSTTRLATQAAERSDWRWAFRSIPALRYFCVAGSSSCRGCSSG
jgi:hypothetical protein